MYLHEITQSRGFSIIRGKWGSNSIDFLKLQLIANLIVPYVLYIIAADQRQAPMNAEVYIIWKKLDFC